MVEVESNVIVCSVCTVLYYYDMLFVVVGFLKCIQSSLLAL